MACKYAEAGNQATVASSLKTATTLISVAGLRPRLYEFTIGADGAPNATDCSMVWQLQLCSTAGTVTSVTPQPLDVCYQAAKSGAGSNATVEPTYTAGLIPFLMGINQRATYRWVAAPGSEIVLVGTASNGIGMQVKSTNYAGQADCVLMHEE
jgi:hypothetical protein